MGDTLTEEVGLEGGHGAAPQSLGTNDRDSKESSPNYYQFVDVHLFPSIRISFFLVYREMRYPLHSRNQVKEQELGSNLVSIENARQLGQER